MTFVSCDTDSSGLGSDLSFSTTDGSISKCRESDAVVAFLHPNLLREICLEILRKQQDEINSNTRKNIVKAVVRFAYLSDAHSQAVVDVLAEESSIRFGGYVVTIKLHKRSKERLAFTFEDEYNKGFGDFFFAITLPYIREVEIVRWNNRVRQLLPLLRKNKRLTTFKCTDYNPADVDSLKALSEICSGTNVTNISVTHRLYNCLPMADVKVNMMVIENSHCLAQTISQYHCKASELSLDIDLSEHPDSFFESLRQLVKSKSFDYESTKYVKKLLLTSNDIVFNRAGHLRNFLSLILCIFSELDALHVEARSHIESDIDDVVDRYNLLKNELVAAEAKCTVLLDYIYGLDGLFDLEDVFEHFSESERENLVVCEDVGYCRIEKEVCPKRTLKFDIHINNDASLDELL